MSDYEIMLADSEYWAGCVGPKQLLEEIGVGAIARIAFLEAEYGKLSKAESFVIRGNMDINEYHITRSWFSLLIAEAEKYNELIKDWPFPVVHGCRIPE